MDLSINKNKPCMMHIDLNSCFATIEQQAHMHLRGKPIAIAAYTTPGGCIIAPSIEAKKLGIKVGMRVFEARLICPDIIVRSPDTLLIRDVHVKFKKIFQDYSPYVTPKSIDEAIIEFNGMEELCKRSLTDIALEIKKRLRLEIGEWISCSIGIATNRFLAKVAAGLHKPDGLVVITHRNLLSVYKKLVLVDLPGINKRFEARLNAVGIFTPIQFFHTSEIVLKKQVFQSILGYMWYIRLRGFEADAIDFKRKSYGQDYALSHKTNKDYELAPLLMKLCEKMGRRIRKNGYAACGIHVACLYEDGSYWHRAYKMHCPCYTTLDLYRRALWVFNQRLYKEKKVSKLSVSCYDLIFQKGSQTSLFDIERKEEKIQSAIDNLNNKYGEYVVTPALMMGMESVIIDRIAFDGVSELENLYDGVFE